MPSHFDHSDIKMEPVSVVTPDSDGNEDKKCLTALSVTELVSILRSAYRTVDYDRVEEVFVDKEAKLTSEIRVLREKLEMERLERMDVEEKLKKYKEQSEKGKKAEERYEKLLQAVKKNKDLGDENTITELRNKNCRFEDEKHGAESEMEMWKRKCEELNERLLMVEKGASFSMNGYTRVEIRGNAENLSGVRRNADKGVSTEAIDEMEMNDFVTCGHESGNTPADSSTSQRKMDLEEMMSDILDPDDSDSNAENAQLVTEDTQSDTADGHDDRSIQQQFDAPGQCRGSHIEVQDSSGKFLWCNMPESQVSKINKRNRAKQAIHPTIGLKTQASKKVKMDAQHQRRIYDNETWIEVNKHKDGIASPAVQTKIGIDGFDQQGSRWDGDRTRVSTSKKRVRGTTRLKKLALRDKTKRPQRIHVEFDEDMNPVGEEGAKFTSYTCLMARTLISIEYPKWKSVKQDQKDKLWEDILLTYDIPATEEMKRRLFKQAANRWKDFKTTLTREYIRGPRKGEHPKERFPFISEEVWEKFKKSREDPQFLELSAKNKERQAKNVYPHYMSRSGYKGLVKRMMETQSKVGQEAAASDSNIVVSPPECPSRQQKWKAARVKKGKYITPEVATVAEKIDQLEEQVSQGLFVPSGRMDILATAIGKPDHPGNVRGVGTHVGLKKYFGATLRNSSSSMVSKDELDERLKQETERVRAQLRKEHEEECNKLREEFLAKLEDDERRLPIISST